MNTEIRVNKIETVVHYGNPRGRCGLVGELFDNGYIVFGTDSAGNNWRYCPTCGEKLPISIQELLAAMKEE